jgi:hypothetical protein
MNDVFPVFASAVDTRPRVHTLPLKGSVNAYTPRERS